MSFGESGQALYDAVTDEFDLAPHELALLREAAHVADICAALQAIIDTEGLAKGPTRPLNTAVAELRQHRILLARLLAALGLPGDDDKPAQRRALRGVYGG